MKSMVDENTGFLMLDDFVLSMPSYHRILADAVITDEEVHQQAQDVISLIRKMELALDENQRELVWNAIGELAVLFELYSMKEKANNGHF